MQAEAFQPFVDGIQYRGEEQRDDERERDDVDLAEQQKYHIEACR